MILLKAAVGDLNVSKLNLSFIYLCRHVQNQEQSTNFLTLKQHVTTSSTSRMECELKYVHYNNTIKECL